MKKTMLGLFAIMSSVILAGNFDKEETFLENELYKNFPTLEQNKKIDVEEIEIDIEADKSVEVDIEFTLGSEINPADYDAYAKKLSKEINKNIHSTLGKNFKLIKLELDTSGIKNDKKIYRF